MNITIEASMFSNLNVDYKIALSNKFNQTIASHQTETKCIEIQITSLKPIQY